MTGEILLRENNVISLRTAFVTDDGNLVELRLHPADLTSRIPSGGKPSATLNFKWVLEDSVWIYRHLRSVTDELELKNSPPCVDQKVRALLFESPPALTLQWSDSGHGVALYVNEEPWAFIDEATHRGYSKGILDATWKNQWNQELFEKLF